jgi:hypothetical protein
MDYVVETNSGTLCKVTQNGSRWFLTHPTRGAGEIEGLMGRPSINADEIKSITQFKGKTIYFGKGPKRVITSAVVKVYKEI